METAPPLLWLLS